ncbi:MAG: GH36 C-terminal domain-containing protein, partial [Victivallaceae bacterium]|nr:GH36 C-terminal domain-containing protein [Victivallaceae bacterium]
TLDRRRKFGSYDLDFLFRVIMFTGFYLGGIPARSPGFQSKLKQYITLYKNFMAPLLSDCRVYHHTPVVRLEGEKGEEPTPYCVWEYTSQDAGTAAVGIFKLTDVSRSYHFYSKGIDVGRKYRVSFDNNKSSCIVDGYILQQQGMEVNLSAALTSELILFEAIS